MSTISPIIPYRDPRAAIDFLCDAFGFERHAVHESEDGELQHVELRLGDDVIMPAPLRLGEPGHTSIYAVVEDADAHHARAAAAGAEITTELRDTDYGSRDYAAKDLEGNMWYFGTYRPLSGEG
jgi:uncharacterized glyoxalase superfamily protein PhnB